MSDALAGRMGGPPAGTAYGAAAQGNSANLADILERVLDKGVVIAGDIQINLLDIELLTIKLRLLVASVDKAKEMGIDWWEHDPSLSSRARDEGPGRQMSVGQQGARAQAAVPAQAAAGQLEQTPDTGSSESARPGSDAESAAEIARLRAEVAELRAAAAGGPEADGTEADGAPGRELRREPKPKRQPGSASATKRARPQRRASAGSDDGTGSARTARSRPARRPERPVDAGDPYSGDSGDDRGGADVPESRATRRTRGDRESPKSRDDGPERTEGDGPEQGEGER